MRRFLDGVTRRIAVIGFGGLVLMAVLTMADALLRWLGLPRIPGFGDYGEVVFALVIATCFPAGLLQGNNITIRFVGRGIGPRLAAIPEAFGAAATLVFFALLSWQFFVLTADYSANARTTATLEMPLAPWWWAISSIMAITIPVQMLNVAEAIYAAVTGREFELSEQITSEVGDDSA